MSDTTYYEKKIVVTLEVNLKSLSPIKESKETIRALVDNNLPYYEGSYEEYTVNIVEEAPVVEVVDQDIVETTERDTREICKNCKFAFRVFCRRYPPKMRKVNKLEPSKMWPQVRPDDTCGEFQLDEED